MTSASAALTGSYDYGEVARSVLIAIFASYAALELSGRVNAARGRVRLAWLSGGAIAMGIGIWAMHFKGMLAFHLPVPVEYHWPTVLASLLVGVLASAVALYMSSRHKMGPVEAFAGSICMGAGIAGMHYIGMAAMRLPAITRYSPLLVTCSILLAILFSLLALFMAFGLREETRWSVLRRMGSATVMGVAVSAMHYTGMAAASFIPASPPDLSYAVSIPPLGNSGVVIAALIVLLAAVTTSSEDRLQAREQLRLVVDTTPAMLYTARPDGSLDFFNKRWLEYLGLSLDDLSGWLWTAAVHPDDLEELVSKWRSASATGEPYEAEARVRRSDGEYRWMLLRKVPLRDQSGNIVKWYGSGIDIEDRRRAEDAVRRSEDHLRLVIDSIPQQIWTGAPDGSLDFFNTQWRSYAGLTLEEVQGDGWERIIHPDDRERVLQAWRESVVNGALYEQEVRRRGADGLYRWFLARGVPLRDSEGRIVRWYGTNTDIDDRMQAEDRLRIVINTVPAMLHSARPDGYVDFFNERWLDYVGASLEDIRGWQWTKVIHPEDVERVVGKWRSSVETGKPFEAEARLRRADGEYRLMLLRKVPLHDETGSIVKWYGSATDIEDRKRAEQELRQAEEHIRAILEYSPNWIFLKDAEGRYLLVNREIERVFGISQEQIKGKTDSEIFPPEQAAEYRANDLKVLRAGLTMECEEIALLEDGPHTSIVHKFPLFDTHGNIYATGGVATDITERKRAEEARRYSEEQYRTVVETATDAVVSIGEDSRILFVNPATTKIFGYGMSELIGRPLTMLMPESLRKLHEAGFRRYLATGQRHLNWQGTELTGLRKNGQEFPVEVSFGETTGNGHKVFTGFIRDISEKKCAENELLKQKEVFQKIFENIPVMIVLMGPGGRHELVNPEWKRRIGWTPEELREQGLDIFAEAFPDPKYRQMVMDDIAASTGEWTDLKVRVRDGRVADLAATFVRLSDGSSLFIGRDITERKRAEQSLLLFRMLIDESNDAIEVIDPETLRFIDINGRACLDLGYSREEMLSLSVYDVDPCVDELILARAADELENSGSAVFESFHRRKDGSTFPVEVSIKQVRLDRVYRVSVVRDITERKLAEAELRESEARFRLVADNAPVMIWMSGTDKLCTYFNKTWLDFTGRSIDRELGNGWAEGVDPEDLQKCMDTYILSFDRREAFKMEYRLRRDDGEFRWVLDAGVPRFNPDGSFAGYIGSCIDLTEQRRAQEQLHQAQEDLARVTRVASMGELAAAIAHEVNQPLTAIVTNGQFCLRRLDGATLNPDELRAAIRGIVNDGTRASAVISRIRGLLTKEAPNRTELDINQIIQDVTILLRNEFTRNRVSLRTELASDLPRVPGDPVQLQQVLINLIMNAIEATSLSTNGRREILIRSAKNRDDVLVQVQDSGPGIKPELAHRIFEPFFTTKAKGTGMGLSISHSIIESHGGRLGIAPSATGQLFEFTLPVDEAGVS